VLVCLGLWAVLFAPVLELGAKSGPVGTRRSIALVVLRPFTTLSRVLGLERATGLVLLAVGRDPDAPAGGELELPEIDLPPISPAEQPPEASPPPPEDASTPPGEVEVEAPEGAVEEPPGTEPTPGIRIPTPDTKLRVVVVGDSLSQGLGPEIERWFDPDVSRVLALGRQSTGLARQDYFNWQAAMRKIELEFRPDLVFVLLGSNDNQSQVTPSGEEVPVGSAVWVETYRQRAATFLEEATSNGTHVVWVGIPVVREHQRWEFYRRVNAIYRETASADPFATYVDAWDLFQTRDGDYSAYLRNERGVLQEMRAPDGLHMTPTGYGYLARAAIRAAADAFGLPQRAVTFKI
jgi:hypothetical protein